MDAWLTWENCLLAVALLVAVRSLAGLMGSLHQSLVTELTTKIEQEQQRRREAEEAQRLETEKQEKIRQREAHLEQIRNRPPAA